MHIAIITSGTLPVPSVRGGAVEHLVELYLKENEKNPVHEFTLYTVDDALLSQKVKSLYKHTKIVRVKTLSLRYRLGRFIFKHTVGKYYSNLYLDYFIKNCINFIKKEKYDAFLLENRFEFVLPLYKQNLRPIIVHDHVERLCKMQRDLAVKISKACVKIIAVSDYIANQDRRVYDKGHILTLHNGIELEKFQVKGERSKYHLNNNDFVVVFFGRLEPIKGVKELIDAIFILQDIPALRLFIIGGNPFHEGRYRTDFVKDISKLASKLGDRIIFSGYIPYEQIPDALSCCDLSVLPSTWNEPFGLTVLETMAAGLPLITTNSGGIPEVVCSESAILLDKTSPDLASDIATSIRDLYKNPSRLEQMSIAAKKRSKLFPAEKFAKKMLDSLSSIQK